MMMFIWMCVMTWAFLPDGERVANLQTSALEQRIQLELDSVKPARRLAPKGGF